MYSVFSATAPTSPKTHTVGTLPPSTMKPFVVELLNLGLIIMPTMTNWTLEREAQLAYSYQRFAQAKVFVFDRWCEQAAEKGHTPPNDLSGSCKFGSLFMNQVFGGKIYGQYEHQYNIIDGRIVDLSHDAKDVGRIANPYLHEPDFFAIPEKQAALNRCLPRAKRWAVQFLLEIELADAFLPIIQ